MIYGDDVKYKSVESTNDRDKILYRHAVSGIISHFSEGNEGDTGSLKFLVNL